METCEGCGRIVIIVNRFFKEISAKMNCILLYPPYLTLHEIF